MKRKGLFRFGKILVVSFLLVFLLGQSVSADEEAGLGEIYIGMSPMNETVVLNPGDNYRSSFLLNNPSYSQNPVSYHIEVKPFFVDEDYNPVFTDEYGLSGIADWITIVEGEKGTIEPNGMMTVEFEINVPESAPAGGQYAAIIAQTELEGNNGDGSISISEGLAMNHVVLAEITGTTINAGQIISSKIRGFAIGDKIKAYATVENSGNVHETAIATMKVYPLFSDEPIYTNENLEGVYYILPGRKLKIESEWFDTPMVGIYNVRYTVEYMEDVSEVVRMVVVCPWWLILLIFMGVIIMILRIITLVKLRQKSRMVFN